MKISVIGSGIVAVLVGFGSSVAIVIAGAQAVGADAGQVASWVSGLCIAMGVSSAYLSYRHKMPMITAWSTPGAALIGATAVGGVPTIGIEAAVGCFLFAAALILLSAAVKPLNDAISKIPTAIAAAMLGGVLIGFSIAVFDAARADPLLVLPLVGLYLVMRLMSATWAVIVVLAAAVAWSFILGRVGEMPDGLALSHFELIVPSFDPAALIGLGLPLFLVSMASQNLPGFAVMKAAGYEPPTRSALGVTGLVSLLTAPFGSHTTTMAAITASLCAGPDTHPDPAKRWPSGVISGAIWLVFAAIGVSIVSGFAALPSAVLVTVAGLALLGPLMASLSTALAPTETRFAAILTVTVTASSLSLFGIGAAFWGLVAGLATLGLETLARRLRKPA